MAITNVLLWICIWTPYAAISAFPALGAGEYVTPLVSQLPSFMGKVGLMLRTNQLGLIDYNIIMASFTAIKS